MLSAPQELKHAGLSSSRIKISLSVHLAILAVGLILFSNWSIHVALAAGPQAQQQSGSADVNSTDQSQQQGKTTPATSPELLRCGGVEVKQSLGTVSVGCPKVWRSDRVFSVLDGIMRDVDSMTIRALEGLDANAANQAAIDLIQNSFDLTAKYDQAAAINNQFALQKLKTARTNEVAAYNADADFRQKLIKQRNDLTLQLFDAQATERQQTQAGTDTTAIQKVETSLQNQITSINNTLNTTPPSISDASLASTASTSISPSDQPQHATLDKMPQGFQDALTNLLKQPTFPPAIAMDNVIDLLHQRIAREFAVIYDDLMRDSEHFDVYLVQFDTSINPKSEARDRGVHVEMAFESCKDGNDPVPLAYELYPSAAAYNIMHGFNQTTHTGITGIAQTVVGFGLQASFQHDHSSLRSGLSQSIYASGFGAGQCRFGWDFAPAPNENRLAPGLRTTYAILRVPKVPGRSGPLHATLRVDWTKRDRRYPGWNPLNWHRSDESKEKSDPKISVVLPQDHVLQVTHVSYVPADSGEKGTGAIATAAKAANPAAQSGTTAAPATGTAASPKADSTITAAASPTPTPRPAVIQVRFNYPVDPNLIVTANDQILRRVRDVRGRGLYSDSTTPLHLAGNAAETSDLSGSRFGLLESDSLGEDTWLQADSHTILLNVGKKTAGTDHFPVIRIIDPSSGSGEELTTLARDANEVRIGEWFFTQPGTLSPSSFQPMFTKPYDPGPFSVFIQSAIPGEPQSGQPRLDTLDIRLVSYATTHDRHRPIYLHDQAQVVLEADVKDHKDRFAIPENVDASVAIVDQALRLNPNWALECSQDRGALVCSPPLDAMRDFCNAPQSRADAVCLKKGCAAPKARVPRDLNCLTNFKVWLDQSPYYGRAGLWGDADLRIRTQQGYRNVPLETLNSDNEDVIARGQYEIREELVDAKSPNLGYAWVADLELVNPAGSYEIPEFSNLQKSITDQLSAALTGIESKSREQAKVKAQQSGVKAEQSVRPFFNTKDNFCGGTTSVPFQVVTTDRGICVVIPYAFFSALPQRLHLERHGNPVSRIELPSLRDELIPHDLKIVPQDKNVYQLQGDNVRAVDKVILSAKDHKACALTPVTRSYNVIQIDITPCSHEAGVQFTVQLGLGDGKLDAYVDLFQTDKSGLETQQVLAIPAKATPAKTDTTNNASGTISQTTTITASAGTTPTATVTQTSNGTPKAAATASTTKSNSTTDQTQKKKNGATQTGSAVKVPTPTTTKTPGASQSPTPNPAATKTPSPVPAATKTPTPGKKKKNDKGTK